MKSKILIAVLAVTAFSCRKGQFAPEHYQGGIVINSSQLSTTTLEVRFDDAKRGDSLPVGGRMQKIFDFDGAGIKDGIRKHIRVFKAGTDQLVTDTSIVLHKGQQPSFRVVYNDDLGLGGFISNTGVPQDSVRIRVIYHDHTAAKKFTLLEWRLYQFKNDDPYYDDANNVKEILTLNENKFSADINIPVLQMDNSSPTNLFARIKDPSTGNFLNWLPGIGVFDTGWIQTFGQVNGGTYWFVNFNVVDNDGAEDGSGVDYYSLEYTYLQL